MCTCKTSFLQMFHFTCNRDLFLDLMTKVRLAIDAHPPSQLTDHVTPLTYLATNHVTPWPVTYLTTLCLGQTTLIGWTWLWPLTLAVRRSVRQTVQLPIDQFQREIFPAQLQRQDKVTFPGFFYKA